MKETTRGKKLTRSMLSHLSASTSQQIIHRHHKPRHDLGNPAHARTHRRQRREVARQVAQDVADAGIPLVRVPRREHDLGLGKQLDELGDKHADGHVDDARVAAHGFADEFEGQFVVARNEFGVAGLAPELDASCGNNATNGR